MKKFAFVLVSLALISGCASPYKSIGIGGGYDETMLSPNMFRVSFRGNGYTSMERAKDYALLRSSDIAINYGFSHFIITEDESYAKRMSVYVPGNTTVSYKGTSNAQYQGSGSYKIATRGTAVSSTSPGYSYDITKPKAVFIVVAFKDADSAPDGAFDAVFLRNSLRNKYNIKD